MCDIDEIKEPKISLKEEEIQETVNDIYQLEEEEKQSRVRMELHKDEEDELRSHQEDAYLCYLKMVRRAKELGKKEFEKNELDAVFDCTFEELEIPEFEDYLKQ